MERQSVTRVAIIGGCGHAGLPLGIVLAEAAAHEVILVDIDRASVDQVNAGEMHFIEQGGEERLRKVLGRSLKATADANSVREADYVVFVTGTPVDEHLNPRVNDLLNVVSEYSPYLHSRQTVILRSTVFPGTARLVWKYLHEHVPGISFAFCPERIAQGIAIAEISSLPQIIAAFSRESEEKAARFFQSFVAEVIRLTPEEAELTKLMANSWRYLHFAIANQFYMIAESAGIDFHRVFEALTYHYPRAREFPRPGFTAGPCLFKDTMQLSAFNNNQFFLGHAAMLVNEGLPNMVVTQLARKMGGLEGKKIGILGMAFKPDNDDIRDSLSYKLKKILELKMATVLDTDRFQPSHARLKAVIDEADGLVLGVPHKEYLSIDLKGKPYVDPWGVWAAKPDLFQSPHLRSDS
jgi:UDP-N-acetyl-D-mannosaminuronic acid dehydrogenase